MRRCALLVLVGCGGVGASDFPAAFQDATCDYYVRCGAFDNATDCHAYFDRIAIDDPNLAAALDKDKIEYHEAAAQACLDALGALSCDASTTTGHELDVCADAFTGTGKQNDACAFDGECQSDNCVKPSCMMACCAGTCGPPRTLPAVGQPCTFACADAAYCGLDAVCHAVLPAGAACDALDACDHGLYCADLTAMSTGTCKALPHLGQPCDTGGCAEIGAVCNGMTCVAAGLPGDACMFSFQCSQFYTCDGAHCVAYPTLGMPCITRCSDASWCNTTTKTCEAQKANGAACTFNDECATHYCTRNACSDVPLCI